MVKKQSFTATRNELQALGRDILSISWELYKIMVPTVIVIKALEMLGGIELFSALLSPLMQLLGLPDAMALVWATTLLTNIYAGMLVFFNHADGMTVAQVSVIGGMMLIGHGLPVELLIARKTGVRLRYSLILRVGGGILYGWLLHLLYRWTDTLNEPAKMLWQPEAGNGDSSLLLWAWEQLQGFVVIFFIIAGLLLLLRIFKWVGIERLINAALAPVLRLFGISRQASTITLVGFTLGLSFGGGLLIQEARTGRLSAMDIFAAMTLIGLCHSMIEDTLLILLLGAHLSAVLWLRLVFAFVLGGLLIFWARQRSLSFQQRHLFRPGHPSTEE